MTSFIPLDKNQHKALKLNIQQPLGLLMGQHMMPLFHVEFIHASAEFPIVFAKDSETGKFTPAALMGLKPGENLFIREGRWAARYLPLSSRPLACVAVPKPDNADELVICIRDDFKYLSETEGDALFNDDGEQSEVLIEQSNIAAQINSFRDLSSEFVNKMLSFELIESSSISVKPKGEEPYDLSGLYVISEKKLSELSSEQFLKLRELGYLPLVYSLIASKARLQELMSIKAIS